MQIGPFAPKAKPNRMEQKMFAPHGKETSFPHPLDPVSNLELDSDNCGPRHISEEAASLSPGGFAERYHRSLASQGPAHCLEGDHPGPWRGLYPYTKAPGGWDPAEAPLSVAGGRGARGGRRAQFAAGQGHGYRVYRNGFLCARPASAGAQSVAVR